MTLKQRDLDVTDLGKLQGKPTVCAQCLLKTVDGKEAAMAKAPNDPWKRTPVDADVIDADLRRA
eukprot:11183766-Lingulodinium_polyedra.AAC.1